MTSRAQLIREWLATQDGPRTPGEIARGIGKPGSVHVLYTIGSMFRDGYLERHRGEKANRYSLGRSVARAYRLTPEERQRRRREHDIARSRAKGVRPMAEFRAEQTAQRDARRAEAKQRRDEARKERARLTTQAAAERADRARPLHERPGRASRVSTATPMERMRAEAAARDAVVPRETVEQWMARTGRQPEVLPMGAVSAPLRFDHRTQNEISWRNRERQAA
jgi:hypothetical protein